MKIFIWGVLLALLVIACTTKNNVTPVIDGGSLIAGVYPLTYIRQDSAGVKLYDATLPYTQGTYSFSGAITVRRDSASVVFLTQTIKETGYADQTSVLGTVRLKSASGGVFDLYAGSQKIGTADGTTLALDGQQTNPSTGTVYRTIITGKK